MSIHYHLINHIQKHHKKYLFGTGVAFGLTALKIITIARVFLGITITTGRSNATNEEMQIYKSLQIFNKIDDIAHSEINESATENPFDEDGKKLFYEIDKESHNAKNVTEKFRASTKIVDLLTEQKLHHPNLGSEDQDTERDKEFRYLLDEFNRLH